MQTIYLPRTEGERSLASIVAFLSALPRNKPWRIRVDEFAGTRTNPQNNALFGAAYPVLCQHIGCLPDELHEIMCEKFFGTKEILGSTKPIRTTTIDENGKRDVIPMDRFQEFYAMVQRIGAELGVYVPDPDRSKRTR